MNQESIDKLVEKGVMKRVTPFNNLYCVKKEGETLIYGRRMGKTNYSVVQRVKDDKRGK